MYLTFCYTIVSIYRFKRERSRKYHGKGEIAGTRTFSIPMFSKILVSSISSHFYKVFNNPFPKLLIGFMPVF